MRAALVIGLLCSGCHAAFIDERPGGAAGASELTGVDLGDGSVVATGKFGGRAGHIGIGDVSLLAYAGGITEIRFEPDFGCTDVPGPVVVLTQRDALGTQLDAIAGDIEVAPLRSPSGGQSYFVRADPAVQRDVFVFCKPYGVEVAKAPLTR